MKENGHLPPIAKNNLAKRGCDMGYTAACASLGIIQNREKKYAEALKSFNFACESGDGESCYMMGKIYDKQGRMKSALKMHKYACDSKNMPRSCLVVGKDFQKNKPEDKKAIYFYLKKACSGAIEEGCFLLDKL